LKKRKPITKFPESFKAARDFRRNSEDFKKGDILERYYGYTYGCLGADEEAYRKKNTESSFTGFTLASIEEAMTEKDPANPA